MVHAKVGLAKALSCLKLSREQSQEDERWATVEGLTFLRSLQVY